MATWYPGASPSLTPPHTGMTPSTPLPPPNNLPPRVLTERESQLVKHLNRLQFFLATAPTRWMGSEDSATKHRPSLVDTSLSSPHPNLNKFLLPNGEHVACVFWNGLYHITGTDIVRALVFRFEAFSRPVRNVKKFEEGVFSDLRNLKPGTDACLEEPNRSDNLTQHYKTHEKQDRGERDRSERLKTEGSEADDEDMGAYLEAQVDAQAEALAKHSAEYFGIGNGGMTPPGYPMSGNLDMP
ncbi:hypothetical protein B9479_008273, partial [Cryptococcus floricola]